MTRGIRFGAQLALLPLLWLLSFDPNAFTLAVGTALLVVWPLTLAVAGILVWLVREAECRAREDPTFAVPGSMVEAAENAVTDALEATGLAVAGLLAVLNVLHVIDLSALLPARPLLVFLGWALILHGVPPVSWLRTLRRVWIPMLGSRFGRG